ncbi:MAG: hypothetical protein KGQ61_12765 [Planctomycetes bacterium]|nr:hypothetical protein [Planctomycetota bacterium]
MATFRHDRPPTDDRLTACRAAGAVRRVAAWTLVVATILAAGGAAFALVERAARDELDAIFGRPGVPMADVVGLAEVVRLADGVRVEQSFRPERDGLDGVQVRTATWKVVPAAADCRWRLVADADDGSAARVIRSGTLDPRRARDWTFLEIPFAAVADSSRRRLSLVIEGPADDPGAALGIPLFTPAIPHPPAVVTGSGPAAGCLHLMLLYPEGEPRR